MKIRILVNPAAGRGRGRGLLDLFEQELVRWDGDLVVSADADDLRKQAKQAINDGVDRLIGVGGDGTFHLMIQEMVGTRCALGIVPLGRGNDLACSLGIPTSAKKSLDLALRGDARKIDLGEVEGRFFGVYGGVGFDGEVARFVNRHRRYMKGRLGYVLGTLWTLMTYVPPTIRVVDDEGSFEGRAMFTVINNCPRFGGAMMIAPQAEVNDGFLDVTIVQKVSRLQLLRVFPKVYRGEHLNHPAVISRRTRSVEIQIDRQQAMFGDGEEMFDVGPEGKVIQVRPGSLRVVTPATPSTQLVPMT
jgi:diacylglycerol kinase (ATP)